MCDFSQYGGPNDELVELLKTLPTPPELDVPELKRVTNEGRETGSREEMQKYASKVILKDHSIRGRDGYAIEARSYRPAALPANQLLPVYIHYHGGGFLFGTLSSEDATCSRMATDAQVAVLNVNYRHTPEWRYPIPWHDTEDAFEWAVANAQSAFSGDGSHIVVGGVSAGGQLSAALCQTKKRENAPSFGSLKGQVLMIPCLAHKDTYEPQLRQMRDPSISSYVENEHAPILPVSRIQMFNDLLYEQTPDLNDRRVNIGNAPLEEVKGLPPATFGIAGLDPLRDEALLYAKLLAENGVPTNVHLFHGVPHGFRRFGDQLSASAHYDRTMHDGIQWALSSPKAVSEIDVILH